jgi:hypothetical protein
MWLSSGLLVELFTLALAIELMESVLAPVDSGISRINS